MSSKSLMREVTHHKTRLHTPRGEPAWVTAINNHIKHWYGGDFVQLNVIFAGDT